ncbi:hypothetical protein TNCV_2247551 [Trichonephila clavipes]|nr:hypothetical protein TNCV_2247551 [Trichonephila clavipes]
MTSERVAQSEIPHYAIARTLNLDKFNMYHRALYREYSTAIGLELMTRQQRVLDHDHLATTTTTLKMGFTKQSFCDFNIIEVNQKRV